MDEATKKAVEARVLEVLGAQPGGLAIGPLTTAIDEVESAKELVALLGDMKRRELIVKDETTGNWRVAVARDKEHNSSARASEPAQAKKLHETAEAILAAFDGEPDGTVLTAGDLNKRCSKWTPANVGYHIKALKTAGLIIPSRNGKGYQLPGMKPVAQRAKPQVRRPNTALLPTGKPDAEPPPAAIPPPAAEVNPAQGHDVIIEMTCPAGRLKVEGTPKLVFGFLEQFKELAA